VGTIHFQILLLKLCCCSKLIADTPVGTLH